MDMNEFLKKAMEAAKLMTGIMSSGKMIRIAKAASDHKKELIDALSDFLANGDKNDRASWDARSSAEILMTAKKIAVLDVLISSAALGSTALDENQYKELIHTVIQVNAVRSRKCQKEFAAIGVDIVSIHKLKANGLKMVSQFFILSSRELLNTEPNRP